MAEFSERDQQILIKRMISYLIQATAHLAEAIEQFDRYGRSNSIIKAKASVKLYSATLEEFMSSLSNQGTDKTTDINNS